LKVALIRGEMPLGASVMGRLPNLLKRFRADERGVFGVIFALTAIVLIALSGAVVDFVSVEQARNRAQVALDAAALALQKDIFLTPLNAGAIQSKAQALVTTQIGDARITATLNAPVIDVPNGSLYLSAHLTVPTMFVTLVGVNQMEANIISEATRKKTALEVAFVLDNSNSMSNSARMTNLIAATKCAANILLNESCTSTATVSSVKDTKLAIVPFTMLVNVGTGNANASWMDRTGSNNITSDNFDDDDNEATDFKGPVDRIALMAQLKNVKWGGCVESRVTPYDTDDTLPVSTTPRTMFTPLFAPDEPDTGGFNNHYLPDSPATCPQAPSCVATQVKNACNKKGSNKSNYDTANCTGTTTSTVTYVSELGVVSHPAACPATAYGNTGTVSETYSYTPNSNTSPWANTRVQTWAYPFTPREMQERMCKYNGATASGISQASARGPNSDCPVNAIQPLTNTKPLITTAISALAPQGGTNIHAGTEWGFRVLSPTEPFTEGSAYSSTTSKVMIIMTDGENTAYANGNMNNTTFYSSYGFPWNGRLGTASSSIADLETEMNARTATTCANAKAAGITVYTVGLAVDLTRNPAANTKMLQDCSSGAGYNFFPASSSELTSVFTNIANQLSALRIAQ
jgi:Flp pilus assembly protein TadG